MHSSDQNIQPPLSDVITIYKKNNNNNNNNNNNKAVKKTVEA